MTKKNKEEKKCEWWKILIVATFILSLISICIIINEKLPKYEYEIRNIKLNNSNTGLIDGKVVDYICDDNVEVSKSTISYNWFYASTWEDGKVPHSYGECKIKVKMRTYKK